MNEPKRRGPKPKCKECGRKHGEGHYDDCSIGMGVIPNARVEGDDAPSTPAPLPRYVQIREVVEPETKEALYQRTFRNPQWYAERVWNGQSPDMPRAWRLERVRLALEGQGLSMEGVKL